MAATKHGVDETGVRRRTLRARAATSVLACGLLLAGCSTTATLGDRAGGAGPAPVTMDIPATDGPGVTSAKVRITSESYYTDTKRVVDAIVGHLNKTGGLGGRMVEVVEWPQAEVAMDAPPAQYSTAMCKAFQDAHIFAAMDTHATGLPFRETTCAQDAGIVTVAAPAGNLTEVGIDDAAMKENPFVFAPSDMASLRLASTLAQRVKDDGILDGVKRAAVLYDPDVYRAEADMVVDKLTEGGRDLRVEKFDVPRALTDANLLSTIIKLKGAGYDLLLPVGAASQVIPPGMLAAQHYAPKVAGFGLSLDHEAIAAVPPEFLQKFVAYDYRPANLNVPTNDMRSALLSLPGAKDCYQILERAGVAFNVPGEAFSFGVPLTWCNQLNFLRAALKASGSTHVNAQAVFVGSGRIGSGLQSLDCFGTKLAPGRRDGADAVRKLVYNPALKSFVFTGPVLPAAA